LWLFSECDDSNFLEENEQSKPLLGGDSSDKKGNYWSGMCHATSHEWRWLFFCFVSDDKVKSLNGSTEKIEDDKEAGVGDGEVEASGHCHCHSHQHQHESSPDTNNQNCIRVRPSKSERDECF
jgi:hypothetical protein